ncbi:MAG: sugar ABC transporter permease [Thermobacillus sp.]|uniref:Xylose transport system permease protein XylH n=1 Tax=Thermobacillus composti (strain DSM 18247 / JCM 13945 / KWC4) TaxID=717605 RepID=L0EBQ2_THECK|nr:MULTISPECIES: multiple monosaccharide ABC transporter permease [Thermobacillus]AGA57054.1 ABC-type xylose transport system, permease component [Thermobacillus composti KWC4]REK56507.1 MAG: sugar ABC transporter permease [Thermobacillus sp.]
MQTVIKQFRANIRQYGMLIALLLIMLLFQILTGGILLKPLNVTNLILQNSYILVLAIGMVLVIISGHIDLSVGSVAAFVGAVAAFMMVELNVPLAAAVVLSLLMGALIGAWQGFWVAYVRVPSFIVTLAGMLMFRGLTMLVLKGQSVGPFPEAFRALSSGFIPDFSGGGGLHLLSLLIGALLSALLIAIGWRKRLSDIRYNFEVPPRGYFIAQMVILAAALMLFVYVLASYEGIPNILIVLLVLIFLYTFVTNRTVIGRHIYAMGGNEKAAMLSGVKTKRVSFWVFVNMGTLAALSGLIFAARLNAATPKAGVNFELDAIAACFIGGASMSGGVGTVVGAVIGGLVMGVMNNGMSILGVGIDWQQAIKGLVLLLAVAFDIYNRNKSS